MIAVSDFDYGETDGGCVCWCCGCAARLDELEQRREAELLAAELGLPSTVLPPDPPYPNVLRYLAIFDHERISIGTGAAR